MIHIDIYRDGTSSSRVIDLGNQYENLDESVEVSFDASLQDYNKYVMCAINTKNGRETAILPINNNLLQVTTQLTQFSGKWDLYFMCRESPLDLTKPIVEILPDIGKHIFISDLIIGVVHPIKIDKKDIENLPLDPNLKFVYDDLLNLIKQVKSDLALGAYNGKSAYQTAVENGFQGTEKEWLDSLKGEGSNDYSKLINLPKINGVTVLGEMTSTELNIKDGKTPIKGVDYFTEQDKNELVQETIKALPKYGGEYVITPDAEMDKILLTKNKVTDKDITIKKIPYFETANEFGRTIYIASESEVK